MHANACEGGREGFRSRESHSGGLVFNGSGGGARLQGIQTPPKNRHGRT